MIDYRKEYIKEYIKLHPKYEFRKCICLENYICNYSFIKDEEYDCLVQMNLTTLFKFKGQKMDPLKTLNTEDFLKFFKILYPEEIRDKKIDDILYFL